MQEEIKLEGKKKEEKEEREKHGPQIPGKRKCLEEGIPTFFFNLRE